MPTVDPRPTDDRSPLVESALVVAIVAAKAATVAFAVDAFVNADTPRLRGKAIRTRAFGYGGALLVVPVLWSGLLHPTLSLLNPLLASRINWFWFIASQMAFGIVAGAVVVRQSPIPTLENVSFALRAGIEAPGTISPRGETRS